MTAVFTPAGGDAVTLVDDANRLFGQLHDLSLEAVEQVDGLAYSNTASRLMRGNVRGPCVLSAWKSFTTADQAAAYLATALSLMNQTGTLALQFGATALSFPGATLPMVSREELDGARVRVRYSFGITAIAPQATDPSG